MDGNADEEGRFSHGEEMNQRWNAGRGRKGQAENVRDFLRRMKRRCTAGKACRRPHDARWQRRAKSALRWKQEITAIQAMADGSGAAAKFFRINRMRRVWMPFRADAGLKKPVKRQKHSQRDRREGGLLHRISGFRICEKPSYVGTDGRAWKVYKISEVPGLPPGEGDYLINFLENRPMWGQQRA